MTKKILWAVACMLSFASCKKEVKTPSEQKPAILTQSQSLDGGGSTKINTLKSLAQAFLHDASISSNFKKVIYTECLKEKYDDYYITVKDLIAMNDTLQLWSSERKQYIQDLVDEIKSYNPYEPIVFIPFLEDKPSTFITNREYPTGKPDAVIKDEYSPTLSTCPGLILNQSDILVPKGQNIDEDYAWANDVWVFGQEEGVSSLDTTINGGGQVLGRFNGQVENGAIIKVTNIGAIESWVAGKPEFLFKVFNAFGTEIRNIELPKVKRKDVKNTWYDFNVFLAYWNTPNIGNWMIEAWAEQDDRGGSGTTRTLTNTFPPPCTGCPSTTINYQIKNVDQDMGRTIIQFSDPISTEYQISHAIIKRKN